MYCIIAGCGRVGSELAKLLSREGNDVVIIDRNQASFRRLGDTFNGLTLQGNAYNLELLKTAGIEKADIFCALTDGDNTNIVAAQVARKIFKIERVYARIYDPQRAEVFGSLGIDVVSGTVLIASMIRDKIMGFPFSGHIIESQKINVLQILVGERLAGKPVSELTLEGEFLPITVVREGASLLTPSDFNLQEGDILFGLVYREDRERVRKKLLSKGLL